MGPRRFASGAKLSPALLLCSVLILTLTGCTASGNSGYAASEAARQVQRYAGTWHNLNNTGNVKIREDETGILVQDDFGHTLVGSINAAGDLVTSFGTISIDPKTGHLVAVTGEYERVSD